MDYKDYDNVIVPDGGSRRNKRSGIMLCIPYEERRLNARFGWSFPVAVQPKLDGHRAVAVRDEKTGSYMLLSSEGNEIRLPHLEDALRDFGWMYPYSFDGEVYCHGMSFEEISSLIKRPRAESRQLCYHVFDRYTPGSDMGFLMRAVSIDLLDKAISVRMPVQKVPTFLVSGIEEINDAASHYIGTKHEGIIIRHPEGLYETKRSGKIMKFKPKAQDEYIITDVEQAFSAEGEPLGMIGSFLVKAPDTGSAFAFKVSAGTLTHTQRKSLWLKPSELIGKTLRVQYQTLTAKGIPRAAFALEVL